MSRLRTGPLAAGLTLATLASLAAACGDSTSPSGIDGAQSAAIGLAARDEVEGTTGGFSVATSVSPAGTPARPACVTASSTADGDGDGVPDDANFGFNGCSVSNVRNGALTVNGQLRIQDPTPGVAGFAYDATANMTLSFDASGQTNDYVAIRNGTRHVTGSPDSLMVVDSATVTRTATGGATTIQRNWTATFTPATPLQINQPLPSGTVLIDGSFTWNRAGESFTTTASTHTPLQYDATCTATPQKIKGGELRLSGTFNGKQGYVRITWSGCGNEPSYSFIQVG